MDITRALIVFTKPASAEEEKTLASIIAALKESGIAPEARERKNLSRGDFSKKEMVISCGGDGTFLLTAHHVAENVPLLGVNSDPHAKEGYLLSADRKTFPSLLEKIRNGKGKIAKLPTLECSVNGRKIPIYAVNEFFVGSCKSYRTSRYEMVMDGKKEVHRSSGVICATPVGVNAWARSVLGMSVTIPDGSFAYVVREPYESRVFSDYRFKKGILKKGEKLRIISKMQDGILVADSLSEEYPLRFNDEITIGLSKRKIMTIAP